MENNSIINKESLFSIARIAKSYHTNGEVVIRITSPFFYDYSLKNPVFLLFNGLPVPFFITECTKRGNNGAIIKFSTINDFYHSEELLNKEIYINTLSLPNKLQKELVAEGFQSSIIGFTLYNQDNKKIGQITDYIEYPNNSCIEVNNTLLPLHEDLILSINIKEKTIRMQVPEGLL